MQKKRNCLYDDKKTACASLFYNPIWKTIRCGKLTKHTICVPTTGDFKVQLEMSEIRNVLTGICEWNPQASLDLKEHIDWKTIGNKIDRD